MKPNAIAKTNFQPVAVTDNWDSLKTSNLDNPFSFQDFTVPQSRMQKEVEPPAYMWDRIAKVLDEQDRLKATPYSNTTFAAASEKKASYRKLIFAAAIIIFAVAFFFFIV